jgi:MFS family permease
VKRIVDLLRSRPALRAFLVANALWELSLAALKTFIMLFLTVGLGMQMSGAVGVIAIVLVLILVAAAVSGKLGDRFGKTRVVGIALWLYGIGLLVPFFTQSPYLVLPILPFVALGGGMILTLPYAILMPLMPEEEHGLITGFYSFSRGLGILLGPALAGLAITGLRSTLPGTDGYAAMWLVCGAAILASLAFMGPLQAKEADLRRRRRSEARPAEQPA